MSILTIELSKEIDDCLAETAKGQNMTKVQAIEKAFALLSIANEQKLKGRSLGIVEEDPESHDLKAISRLVGV